jgi:hypothetical protein
MCVMTFPMLHRRVEPAAQIRRHGICGGSMLSFHTSVQPLHVDLSALPPKGMSRQRGPFSSMVKEAPLSNKFLLLDS